MEQRYHQLDLTLWRGGQTWAHHPPGLTVEIHDLLHENRAPQWRTAGGRLVETSAPVQKDDAMADDSTTIALSRSELREVAGYAVACARPALAIFERERLTIGAHERRSTLRRRSQMEASGPRPYVTARGQPTGRLSRPAMRDRLRRATPRARPATRWVRRSSTPCRKLHRSSTS